MLHCLIIYEVVPEETKFYLVPMEALSESDLATLRLAAGCLAGTEGMSGEVTHACDVVSDWLALKREYCNVLEGNERCKLRKYLVTAEHLATNQQTISMVVWTGFVL